MPAGPIFVQIRVRRGQGAANISSSGWVWTKIGPAGAARPDRPGPKHLRFLGGGKFGFTATRDRKLGVDDADVMSEATHRILLLGCTEPILSPPACTLCSV